MFVRKAPEAGPAISWAPAVASQLPEQAAVRCYRAAEGTGEHVALKREVHTRLIDEGLIHAGDRLAPSVLELMRRLLMELAAQRNELLSRSRLDQLVDELIDEIQGLGPLEPLMRDPDVSEIMVNAHDQVFIEQGGRLVLTDVAFADDDHLLRTIDRIVSRVGRHVDEASPMCDARLPDGSRVNVILPPLALKGPCLTIRRFARDPLTVDDLVLRGSLDEASALFLRRAVEGKLNILVSGGTGTGKTTLLNVLSSFVPAHERLVTIEDAAELQLQRLHVVKLETRQANAEGTGAVTQAELLVNCLRMRPDRIIIGEVRGGEALTMLQAMNTGHEGSMTTVHANTCRDALARLETMVLMAGMDLPHRAIREQLAAALDLVVQLERTPDGRRRITTIAEIVGMEGEVYLLQDLFVLAPGAAVGRATHRPTGLVPRCLGKLAVHGVHVDLACFRDGGRP